MPGPSNKKKSKKVLKQKEKQKRTVFEDKTSRDANQANGDVVEEEQQRGRSEELRPLQQYNSCHETVILHDHVSSHPEERCFTPTCVPYNTDQPCLTEPFVSNRGDGARVTDVHAYLSSFFCPPISWNDERCSLFAPREVFTVLCAVLPEEIALILWYNKTRSFGRICPACHRIYKLGDSLVDPVSGETIDINDSSTPPQVLREQQLSGICSLTCFILASYSSHPYTTEVARGAWGHLQTELDPNTRSLLDATDPRSAAIIRYGLAACPDPSSAQGQAQAGGETFEDAGLGRLMRMTRRMDLGLGEVLEAVRWYGEQGRNSKELDSSNKSPPQPSNQEIYSPLPTTHNKSGQL